jgi:hypothetical protein
MTLPDIIRIGANLALAVAQIALSSLLFRGGFEAAPGPVPVSGPAPIVPAGYAFAIWGPIYLGSLAYAVYMALPQNWAAPLFREIGWLTAIGFLGCAIWLLAAKYGPYAATVPIIALMLIGILTAFIIARERLADGPALQYWLVAAPLALYAGWLSVATFANTSEVLAGYGFERFGLGVTAWALLLLCGALAVALGGLWLSGGDYVYAGTVIWALAAIAAANFARGDGGATIAAFSVTGALAVAAAAYAFSRAS